MLSLEEINHLRNIIEGEVLDDDYSKALYSTDASLYQILPKLIVIPKTESDVIESVRFARIHNMSILPRGGATSLAGQTVGASLILDFSKYFINIIDFNLDEKWVRVQPGISRDELNRQFITHGLCFAPDPATSSRANIGGMIANNSSGTKSILYGKTVDHVLSLRVLLSNGEILELEEKSEKEYEEVASQNSIEGEIYKGFRKILFENAVEVEKVYPKVMRRVGGYNLDEFTKTKSWNLSKLVTGSEGTLAIILEAKIKLVELPKSKAITVVHFADRIDAIRAVETIIEFKPAAIEILDRTVLDLSRKNMLTAQHCDWIKGDPGAVLLVEFYGNSPLELQSISKQLTKTLKAESRGYHYPFYKEGKEYNDVWMIRKKGLGLLLGKKSERKAVAFIEDAAIPLKHLPEYIDQVVKICTKYKVEAAVYAHASVGVIHVRPFLDMKKAADIELFKKIGVETFQLVKKYNGSWSGEHGDGLVRSSFNPSFFGDQIYQSFKEIKQLFDPDGLLNPGKIINAQLPEENLRYGPNYTDLNVNSVYHYRKDGSFQEMVHMCNGVGECRRKTGGTMCPSYKATYDEKHSTRGRANALRMTMSGQMKEDTLTNKELLEVLDLCVSCKACKSECPSNVDMAKLKSEVWQQKYDEGKISLREKFISRSHSNSKFWSGRFAKIANFLQSSYPSRLLLDVFVGISRRRKLPNYSSFTLIDWYDTNYKKTSDPISKIALFADTYLNYHEPEIGKSIIELLQSCGFEIVLVNLGCCQRPRISNGFLRLAKEEGTILVNGLDKYLDQNIPILVSEPSCASALQDDLPDLIDDEDQANRLIQGIRTIEQYLAKAYKEGIIKGEFKSKHPNVAYHAHCHEKALYGTSSLQDIFNAMNNVKFVELESGCCGMAGSFGYEKEHFETSKKIAEDALLPNLLKLSDDIQLISSGFSCRHQIRDFSSKEVKHWAEVISFERAG